MKAAPCALAIGGLDPGGGAGLAADLRAFAAAGVFGCAAAAVLTVQSTAGLRSARALAAREVVAQAGEVLRHQRVRAVKVGALGSAANVAAVARLLAEHPRVPVVVDTPMRATRETRATGARGARSERGGLLAQGALGALRTELLPRATLVTVNLDEAEALTGQRVRATGEAHDAARALLETGARAVLVKGGHLTGPTAIDVLAVDGEVIELRARRLEVGPVHGTGCALASLIAGRLAMRSPERAGKTTRPSVDTATLVEAVRWAKRVHHAALARAVDVGAGMKVLMF